MNKITVDATNPSHVEGLVRVIEKTGLFPAEMLPEMLADAFNGSTSEVWLTCLVNDDPVGLCYAKAEALAEGTWNMLALSVRPDQQGHGLGSRIVSAMEQGLAAYGARILLAETSGTFAFSGARAFYRKGGYQEVARIRDFWADGDDKVVFSKRLT